MRVFLTLQTLINFGTRLLLGVMNIIFVLLSVLNWYQNYKYLIKIILINLYSSKINGIKEKVANEKTLIAQ